MNKERGKVPIEKIILSILAVTGIMMAIAIAPGIGPALKLFGVKKTYHGYYINRALKKVNDKGYISYIFRDGKQYARLTKKGQQRLSQYESQKVLSSQNYKRKRDGKWHIVIFDIKEGRRITRNKIRRQLVATGFMRLQNSVWVSPYVSDELVSLLKADNHIGKDVIYIRADYIEEDSILKKKFGL